MFKFKGISNEAFKVIPVEENFFSKAAILYESVEIEGKDGADYYELGYQPIEKDLELQMLDTSLIDEIMAWLNGSGMLEYEGRVTNARFYSSYDVDRFVTLKKANVSYIRDPFWTPAIDVYEVVTTNAYNTGNIYSFPMIKLTGTGTVDITVNNVRLTYTFNGEPYVEIDCESGKEKYNGLSRSRQLSIGMDYPKLNPGVNIVTLHSGTCTIEMKRKDRWL